MNRNSRILLLTIGLSAATVGILSILLVQNHMPSSAKNPKPYLRVEKKADALAQKILRVEALHRLQPWAIQLMRRFEAGQVRTNGGNTLFWADNAVTLSPLETPDFISKYLGTTDRLGRIWPDILIVISNTAPQYVVLKFDDYGVAVGSPDYYVSFGPQWSQFVQPGLYTYAIEQ